MDTSYRSSIKVFAALCLLCLVASYLLLWNDRLDSFMFLVLPISYLLLGMLIKYGDQAYDVGCFDRRKALVLAFPSGIWLGHLMLNDPSTATIGVGMLLGLLVAGKYDNRGFIVGFAIAITIAAIGYLQGSLSLSIGGLLLVIAATFIDEKANDLEGVDELRGIRDIILHQRPFLKVGVLILCMIGVFPSFAFFFMLLCFDFGYSLVDSYSGTLEGCR